MPIFARTGLAASWDERLAHAVGGAIADEFVGKGANVLLGPSVDLARTPTFGRTFESLSGEDPWLGAALAAPFVRAVQARGVIAVAKHFAAYTQERARTSLNAVVDERTRVELYYP